MWRGLEEEVPGVQLANLADVCPCGFAHILSRCLAMEGDVDPQLLEQNLLKWIQGVVKGSHRRGSPRGPKHFLPA